MKNEGGKACSWILTVVGALAAFLLLAIPATAGPNYAAWAGSSSGPAPVYSGKDTKAAQGAGYDLVYASGNWVSRPTGLWASPFDISCGGCGGTLIAIPSPGNGGPFGGPYALGFTFNYFGNNCSNIWIQGYGFIGFGGTTCSTPGNPCNQDQCNQLDDGSGGPAPNYVMQIFTGTEMDASCAPAKIYTKQVPESSPGANDRVFVVQFNGVPTGNGCGGCGPCSPNTYQVRLFQAGSVIEVHYNSINNNDPFGGRPVDSGIRGGSRSQILRYSNYYIVYSSGAAVRQDSNNVVQYRPPGVKPTAVDDPSYTLNYNYGANPSLKVAGFPTNLANSLMLNDKSVGSASMKATYTAGSLSAGVTLQGFACTGATGIDSDGGFCFTASGGNPCASSPYTFKYKVNDAWGLPSADATATVAVINCDNAPVANADPQAVNVAWPAGASSRFLTTEDLDFSKGATSPNPAVPNVGQAHPACMASSGLLCNDEDDGIGSPANSLAVSSTGNGQATAAGATVDISADGSFAYHKKADFCGQDSFNYADTDGIRVGTAGTAYVSVSCAQDNPAIVADSFAMFEDCNAAPSNPGSPCTQNFNTACAAPSAMAKGVLCNDSDPDTNDDAGGGTNSGNTAGVGDAAGPRDVAQLCSDGNPAHNTNGAHGTVVLSADGSFTYAPAVNYNSNGGDDSFWYQVYDPASLFTTACAKVTISIVPVSDVPIATSDEYIPSGFIPNVGPTTVSVSAGVLANDVNPDNLNPPANAGLTVNNWFAGALVCGGQTGMSLAGMGTDGHFTFNAPTNPGAYVGDCTFQYTNSNGAYTSAAGTVTLHLATPVAPFAIQDSYTLNEDCSATAATSCAVPLSVNTACVPSAPNPSGYGKGVFCNDYLFSGGSSAPPVAVLDGASCITGGCITLNPDGSLSFTPSMDFNGGVTFSYHFTQLDGAGTARTSTNSALINFNVVSVNDPPLASDVVGQMINEGTSLTLSQPALLALAAASDAHGGAPTENDVPFSIVLPAACPGGLAIGSVSMVAGNVQYTPIGDDNGPDTFCFQVQDSGTPPGLSLVHTLSLTVTPVNDVPVSAIDKFTAVSGFPFTSWSRGQPPTLANDCDQESATPCSPHVETSPVQTLSAVLVGPSPANAASFTLNADGSVAYQSVPGFLGSDFFQYRASDGIGMGNVVTVEIEVKADTPPTAAFTSTPTGAITGEPVTFHDASFDVDPVSSITSWSWEFGDGRTATGRLQTHTYAGPGTYLVCLMVTDDWGVPSARSCRSITITTPPATPPAQSPPSPDSASPPIAVAGGDQTVLEGASVKLHGGVNGRTPAEVTYSWTQVSGPAVTLVGAYSANVSFIAPRLPTLASDAISLALRVSDASTTSEPDVADVFVLSADNAPVPNAGAGQTVSAGDTVRLDGSKSSDPDDDTLIFLWSQTAGPPVLLSAPDSAIASFVVPAGLEGAHLTFHLDVFDGRAHASDTTTVQVVAKSVPATLTTSMVSNGTYAFATGAPGVRFDWDFGDHSAARTADAETTHTFAASGDYTTTVRITDSDGAVRVAQGHVTVSLPSTKNASETAAPATVATSGSWFLPAALAAGAVLVAGGVGVLLYIRSRRPGKKGGVPDLHQMW
jgi:PKD repeat protein